MLVETFSVLRNFSDSCWSGEGSRMDACVRSEQSAAKPAYLALLDVLAVVGADACILTGLILISLLAM